MKVFLTGAAGFIGFHLAKRLLDEGNGVYGFDAVNDYYDPHYKNIRLDVLQSYDKFSFQKGNLEDSTALSKAYHECNPSHVVNLAAQAGVRYSLENPHAYVQSNLVGFVNLLELNREAKPENFVYASSSSVYGGNDVFPFSESHLVNNPVSLYAATKISNELMATSYGNLFQLNSTGLRFFTVYGTFGRPDMAYFIFSDKLSKNEKLPLFNGGKMKRDFTFVDDVVDGTVAALKKPQMDKVYNLGRGKQEDLMEMITCLEEAFGKKAEFDMLPMQNGDVKATYADISLAQKELGYHPKTDMIEAIPRFVDWFKEYAR